MRADRFRGRRPAFTLIEMIATMAVLTIVSASVYQLFSRLSESTRVTAKHELFVREAYRLADRFRSDVRRSTSVEVIDDGRGVRLMIDDGSSAQYHLTTDGVIYSLDSHGGPEAPSRRDRFLYNIDESLRFRIDKDYSLIVLPLDAGRGVSLSSGSDFRRRPVEVVGVMP